MSTSARSKSSSAKNKPAIDRPFDAEILARARSIAQGYQVVIWHEQGEWYGRGVELPFSMNDGKTPEQCIANVRDTFVTTIAVMLEDGKTPPPPASQAVRNEQMNIRLTADEKLRLETAARRKGFEGVSDFVRTAALQIAEA
jgi:predicted RNase H-like HicB family nuclease